MAFFKFRKDADESPRAPAQPQSIEAIRQRAKYRLAGATVLVLVGVVGLPMLFDKQPRPIAVDTPISIPDKNKVLPLVMPATSAKAVASAPSAAAAPSVDTPAVVPSPVTADKKSEENKAVAPVDKGQKATNTVVTESLQAAKTDTSAAASKAPVNASPAPTAKPAASRAQALLDGKDSSSKTTKVDAPKAPVAKPADAASDGRVIVQVGAYADNAHAHEVRLKLEHAGLKTYAQAVDTKDGKRIRVRVGPFATKAEAEKAAEKIKKLNLPAALLTL